jgi:septal ring factor EnvC (AmiA/AmiB activator)
MTTKSVPSQCQVEGKLEDQDSAIIHNESLQKKLKETLETVKRLERQLEKSQSYNEELRCQIERLSQEVHKYRTAEQHRVNVEVQVTEAEILEGIVSYILFILPICPDLT